jgi:hypothetical protein
MEISQKVYQCDQCPNHTDALSAGAPMPDGWKTYRLVLGMAGPVQNLTLCPTCVAALAWPDTAIVCDRCQVTGAIDAAGNMPLDWNVLKLVAGPFENSPAKVMRFCPACSGTLHLSHATGGLPAGIMPGMTGDDSIAAAFTTFNSEQIAARAAQHVSTPADNGSTPQQ